MMMKDKNLKPAQLGIGYNAAWRMKQKLLQVNAVCRRSADQR